MPAMESIIPTEPVVITMAIGYGKCGIGDSFGGK